MLKKISLMYVFIFLSSLQFIHLSSMEKEASIPVYREAIEKARETVAQIPDVIKKVHERKQNQINETIKQLKNQNTVLLKLGKYFAFYKADIVRGGLFGLDLLAEFYTYKKIFNEKVAYVLDQVKKDSQNLTELLKKAEFAPKPARKSGVFGFITNRFKRASETLEDLELKKYINAQHKMIGYNPFKGELLLPLGLNLIKTKVLQFAENSFLTSINKKHYVDKKLCKAYRSAYEKDEHENFDRLYSTPLSLVTVLISLLHPRYLLDRINLPSLIQFLKNYGLSISHSNFQFLVQGTSLMPGFDGLSKMVNKTFNLKIPDIFFSDIIKNFAPIISLGLSVKFTDTMLNRTWTSYVIKNKTQFLELLEQYAVADKDDIEATSKIENELKKFISYGHAQSMLSNIWTKNKYASQWRTKLLFLSPVISLLVLKLCS